MFRFDFELIIILLASKSVRNIFLNVRKMSSVQDSFKISNGFGVDVSSTKKTKHFHDVVHGDISLPIICSYFMNTPQFQRLKDLKQLGLCYHVFPSASNNRFEHCVGTSYLAGEYGKLLRQNQPELNITDEDILCLYLAGLCHDIGHGPFSHMWERFMKRMDQHGYEHELMSLKILDYLIEDVDNHLIKPQLEAENLGEQDINFIKELILGRPLPGNNEFVGRKPCKHFLYQIVSNDQTKIDVDKFDYLLRDCQQLGVSVSLDYKRIMNNSRVIGYTDGVVCDTIKETTPTKIVYRKKIESSLEDVFRSRYSMHQKVYQHRVTRVIEEMVLDALKAAASVFEVEGNSNRKFQLATAWEDPSAFIKLTDSIETLMRSWGQGGPLAKQILDRIIRRKLYRSLGVFDREHVDDPNSGILDELTNKDSNIRFVDLTYNFGGRSKENNPLNKVVLFEKCRPDHLILKEKRDQPEERKIIIIYCDSCEKSDQDKYSSAKILVENWAKSHNIELSHE